MDMSLELNTNKLLIIAAWITWFMSFMSRHKS